MTTIYQSNQSFRGRTSGTIYRLGAFVARGGEGEVHKLANNPERVAKLYTKPMSSAQAEKISALIKIGSTQLTAISAWPQELLLNEKNKPVGFVMPYISYGLPIHQLATPAGRLKSMPDASYASLVGIAANLARAVATFHHAGIVLGDINGSNFLVLRDGTVRIIDCDSVQIGTARKFRSPVAMEEFVPPELQGKRLSKRRRTINHDAFALAVIIFQLLVLGRHPFSGNGDMPLGRAIRKRRHAFKTFAPAHNPFKLMEVRRSDLLSPELVSLFGSSFGFSPLRGLLFQSKRPTALQWLMALEAHQGNLKTCELHSGHKHPTGARQCPWCALEQRRMPPLFHGVARQPVPRPAGWWRRLTSSAA